MVVVKSYHDIDRIILVSRANKYSRVVDIPQMNSAGKDVEIEVRIAKAGEGLQQNTVIDPDGLPTLKHVQDMILNQEDPEVHQGDFGGDGPSREEIRKQIIGR